jgi:hypothetical protein
MMVDKDKILDILRRRGQYDRADWVDRELPDMVDTDHNAGLLATLRLNAADLVETSP